MSSDTGAAGASTTAAAAASTPASAKATARNRSTGNPIARAPTRSEEMACSAFPSSVRPRSHAANAATATPTAIT